MHNDLERLDSGFRRNDEKPPFQIFYEIINGWITKEGFRLPSIFRERFPLKNHTQFVLEYLPQAMAKICGRLNESFSIF